MEIFCPIKIVVLIHVFKGWPWCGQIDRKEVCSRVLLRTSDLMGMHRVIEASEKWGFVAQSLGLKWREDLLPSPEKSVL